MYYYLVLFCFGSHFLRWCVNVTDGDGWLKYIEERHEHSQKIIKRILKFCDSFRGNTSLSALQYFDLKSVLGIKHGYYNFYKLLNDNQKHHKSMMDSLDFIINSDGWSNDLNDKTRDWLNLFLQIHVNNVIPHGLNQHNYHSDLGRFMQDVHESCDIVDQLPHCYSTCISPLFLFFFFFVFVVFW